MSLLDRWMAATEYDPSDRLSVEVFKAFCRFITPPFLIIDIFVIDVFRYYWRKRRAKKAA